MGQVHILHHNHTLLVVDPRPQGVQPVALQRRCQFFLPAAAFSGGDLHVEGVFVVEFAVHGEEYAFSASRWSLHQNRVFCILVDAMNNYQFVQQFRSQQIRLVSEALVLLQPNLEVFLVGDQLLLRSGLPVE